MSDEFDDLDDLKAAMRAATPAPDPDAKAENLALAQKNFETLQESRAEARPTSDRPGSGIWRGVRFMLNTLSSRAALTATTAIVAVAFVALTPAGRDLLMPPQPGQIIPTTVSIGQSEEAEEQFAATETRTRQARELAETAQIALDEVTSSEMADVAMEPQALSKSAPAPVAGLAAPSAELRMQPGRMVADDVVIIPEADTEAYANEAPNPLKVVVEEPVSTFSIDVDTASYGVVRNSLLNGYMPPREAVRVEEMINYFPYAYPGPEGDVPFQPTVSVVPTPWNAGTQLIHIGIQGEMPVVEDRPPLNLVFLIDTSGSMNSANKLPLLKQSFALMLSQLRPEDQVSIVTYAGSAGRVLEPTAASDRTVILNALNRLDAGGSTAGQAGLQQAYATATEMAEEGEVTRVILATDGDFNVGIDDPEALKDFIADKRDTGVYLSVLGFGRGNLDDATMQALAQNGNGQAAYIDTLSEAQKVLVDQLTGALFPIANDVKIQVEFNPAQIAEYRLIGYETRALRREDFNNDAVDAGDIGAGHSVTAIYEVTPVGSPAQMTEPLRYQESEVADVSDELAFLRLRYKEPGASVSQLIEQPITADLTGGAETGFAVAIAGFGQVLRGGNYLVDWSYDDAIALANANRGDDPFGYRTEAIRLMRLAETLDQ